MKSSMAADEIEQLQLMRPFRNHRVGKQHASWEQIPNLSRPIQTTYADIAAIFEGAKHRASFTGLNLQIYKVHPSQRTQRCARA
jgi:hypothetical protein